VSTSTLYTAVYFGGLLAVALLEWALPRRPFGESTGLRWFGNFGLQIIGGVLVRALFPLFGVGWAAFCREHGLGFFNVVHWPAWIAFALTIPALDLAAYAQHYVLHRVPVLWRVHRAHHSDLDCDFSTGLRFHPFEAVYSTAILCGVILALGVPPAGVLISQILALALDFVEHANLRIPASLEHVLRLVVVTPDMHRIHHSQDPREGNSNFANVFSWWDRIFGTYVDHPAAGHEGIKFGLTELSDRKHLTLPWMLADPFLSPVRPAAADRPPTPEPVSGAVAR